MKKKAAKLILLLLLVGLLGSAFWQGPAPGRPVPIQTASISYVTAGIFDWLEEMWEWLTGGFEEALEWVEGIGEWLGSIGDWFGGFFEGVGSFFENVISWFGGSLEAIGDWFGGLPERFMERFRKIFTASGDPEIIVTGGYSLWNGALPGRIQSLFNIFEPIGMVILIICWAIRVGATGIDKSLDFGIRNSAATIAVQLIVGMAVMSIGPQLIMNITGLSYNLTTRIVSSLGTDALTGVDFATAVEEALARAVGGGLLGIFGVIQDLQAIDGFFGKLIFFYLIQFTFILNIAYMAVLCGVSPLFFGFAAGGESTRRIALNFLKEFIKTALVPPMVFAYATIAFALMDQVGILLSGLVIGISCVGFARNKLDRLLG